MRFLSTVRPSNRSRVAYRLRDIVTYRGWKSNRHFRPLYSDCQPQWSVMEFPHHGNLHESKSETCFHQAEPERYTSWVEAPGLCCICEVRHGICQYYMGSSLHQGQWCTGESPEEGCSLDHKQARSGYKLTALLHQLHLEPLEERRRISRLTFLYKILNEHVAVPTNQLDLVLCDRPVRGSTTKQRLKIPRCASTQFQKPSEAICLLHHARRRAHSIAEISVRRLAISIQIQIQSRNSVKWNNWRDAFQ